MPGLMIDTTPLRVSRDFRLLWLGQAVSFIGTTMTTAALPYQMYHQTNSSLMVGVLGAVQLGPMLVCSITAGALADSIDKRKLLLCVTLASLFCSAGLAINAGLTHPQLWLLFVLGAIDSSLLAMTFPSLRSLLPLLLEPEMRPAGFALQATYGSFGMMLGPAIAGVLIAALGLPRMYLIDVATFVVALPLFYGIASAPPIGTPRRASFATVVEGFKFLRGQSVIMSVFGIDLLAMVFGMPRALFPALTAQLGGGPKLYGFMLGSVAAGAFVASITSGWTGRVRRQGRAVILCVGMWGLAIAIAGFSHNAIVVLVLFAFAGGADMISGVYRSAIAADVTPDELRGRISGVEISVYGGGPVLGDVEAGVVGGLVSVPFAIVSGGVACVVGAALFATRVPTFAKYERHYAEPTAAPAPAD
ncbi:MAG TPA: MFS transporter [Acidimicrobiia bacterium]